MNKNKKTEWVNKVPKMTMIKFIDVIKYYKIPFEFLDNLCAYVMNWSKQLKSLKRYLDIKLVYSQQKYLLLTVFIYLNNTLIAQS